ncbi:hypothetical protein MAM1_0746d11183 [Mucor ambiguus]|uniref:HMG box domain-containing protein n=1 Tax=Mucor ambiguus TaxID=91626 RepID=A0A0C9NA05_9FUNG|nr:hypothetical protein MAM1_0746d11183 [Mucor ambiguus]
MQTLPVQHNNNFDYIDCSYQSVEEFLHHCHLDQYLDIFLSEGFDSVTSLLEITEEDMIFMNVKRGHRRLIQREIANVKGIPRDQPLATNVMDTKFHSELMPNTPSKMDEMRRINNSNSTSNSASNIYNNNTNNRLLTNNLPAYDSNVTGLTSPRSMNSGIGGNSSASSGNNSSSGPNNVRSRMHQQQPPSVHPHSSMDSGISSLMNSSSSSFVSKPSSASTSNTNDSNNTSNNNSGLSASDRNDTMEARSNSISSNDDADSINTNESVPTKRKYRRHAKPDRNAPIKPPSAYIMFSNDSRAELKNQNLSFAELAKIVGDQWKNLSHMEKQSYERRAMRAKDEYLAALEQYRQTPQYHRYQEYLNEFKSKQDAANRIIGRARKRAKQASPESGSIADSSSNGNSNGNGSSGSGSADTYGDKETVMRRQRQPSENDITQPVTQQEQNSSPSIADNQPQKGYPKYNDSSNAHATPDADILRPIYNHHHNHHHHHHQQPQQQTSSDSGYASQSYYNANTDKTPSSQWNHRSNQIMRGMLPVEFVPQNHLVEPPKSDSTRSQTLSYNPKKMINDNDMGDDQEDENENENEKDADYDEYMDGGPSRSSETKRRSPRFNKSRSKSSQSLPPLQT